jgi:hypothetical protein
MYPSHTIKAHWNGTVKRMADQPVVLAVQDTTGVNYNGQRNMEGNGYISDKTMGVNIHTCLAVTPDGLAAADTSCPIALVDFLRSVPSAVLLLATKNTKCTVLLMLNLPFLGQAYKVCQELGA